MKKPTLFYNWLLSGGVSIDPVFDDMLVQYDFNNTKPDVISHTPSTGLYQDMLRGYRSNLPNGFTDVGLNGTSIVLSNAADCYQTETARSNFSFNSGGNDLPFTVELWFKLNTGALNRWMFGKRNATADREYDGEIDTSNRLTFSVYTAGGVTNYLRIRTNSGLTAGQWYHIVYTYSGSELASGMKIYVNGVQQATTSIGAGSYTGMTTYSTPFVLGNLNRSQSQAVQGQFDQLTIWSRELSQDDVTNVYNSGTPKQRTTIVNTIYETKNVILHKRGNYIFATDGGSNLLYSSDNGLTWYTKAWGTQVSGGLLTHDRGVTCARVFDNGDVMFATAKTVYYSTDGLVNINTSTVLDKNGAAYVFHTPVTATRPGAYFFQLNQSKRMEYNGSECFVWGNYCNSIHNLGASPVVVWATFDNGQTVREVYTYGQNPNYRDDGSALGGNTGTLLGDAGNPAYTRHVHSVAQKPSSGTFYACTGDENPEIRWLKLEYNGSVWTPTFVVTGKAATTKFKVGQIEFNGTDLYWCADSTGTTVAAERGVFKTTEANIDVSQTQLFDVTNGAGNDSAQLTGIVISNSTGKIMVTPFSALYASRFYIAESFGIGTVTEYLIPPTGGLFTGLPFLDTGYFMINQSTISSQPSRKTTWIKD